MCDLQTLMRQRRSIEGLPDHSDRLRLDKIATLAAIDKMINLVKQKQNELSGRTANTRSTKTSSASVVDRREYHQRSANPSDRCGIIIDQPRSPYA